MSKQKVIFVSHCSDHLQAAYGAHKWLRSAQHFMPDIPVHLFGTEAIEAVFRDYPGVDFNTVHPFLCEPLMDEYETVVHCDADSVFTSRPSELLDWINAPNPPDVIGVRNNNDLGMAGKDPGITEVGIPIGQYLNCGLVAVRNRLVYIDWMSLNMLMADSLPFQEQSVVNRLLHGKLNPVFRQFTVQIIDPVEANRYYGLANAWGTQTHWDSWKELYVEFGELWLRSPVEPHLRKRVVVLHHGGGHASQKLDFDQFGFRPEVRAYLEAIVQ